MDSKIAGADVLLEGCAIFYLLVQRFFGQGV